MGVGRIGRRNEVPHVDLLFVEKEMHGQGIARELVRRLLDIARRNDPSAERVTVNATRYAVPFYARVGFASLGEERDRERHHLDADGDQRWPRSGLRPISLVGIPL